MWDWTWRKPGSTTYDYHLVMLIISDWDWRCPLPVYTNSSSSCLRGIFCCQTSWTCRINPLLLGPLVTTGVIKGTINKMLKLHGLQGIYSAWLETITAHILLMCHLGSFCSVHRFPFFFPGCVSSPPELPAISQKVWKSHKWSTEISRPLCFNWIWTKTTSFRLTSLYLMLLFCKKRGISEHLYPIIMTLDL